jgi:hypothetical protein
VISLDWEHGTRMDNSAPAPNTYSMSQVGYNTMLVMYKKI